MASRIAESTAHHSIPYGRSGTSWTQGLTFFANFQIVTSYFFTMTNYNNYFAVNLKWVTSLVIKWNGLPQNWALRRRRARPRPRHNSLWENNRCEQVRWEVGHLKIGLAKVSFFSEGTLNIQLIQDFFSSFLTCQIWTKKVSILPENSTSVELTSLWNAASIFFKSTGSWVKRRWTITGWTDSPKSRSLQSHWKYETNVMAKKLKRFIWSVK